MDEIVDKDVAKGEWCICCLVANTEFLASLPPPAELEAGVGIINWSAELVDNLSSRLLPLWNRTAGDCLLDSVLQATWGVVDRDSTLRRAMADSLVDGASRLV